MATGPGATDRSHILRGMAELVVGWSAADDEGEVMPRARMLLLDALGCAIAARAHPAVAHATAVATRLSPGTDASGLGGELRLGVLGAVIDSGAAIRALDFNDFYWGPGLGGHPSDLFAVAMAVGESVNATLSALIEATVTGYEVYIRLLDLLSPVGAFDHTTANALGAAAIAGRLRGLDAEAMAHALAIAVTTGPSLAAIRQGHLSELKAFAPACMAMNGVLAVSLAQAGVTGPLEAACGPQGLGAIVDGCADVEALGIPRGFGTCLLKCSIKRFPCIGTAQAAVAAAIALRTRLQGSLENLATVEIHIADNAVARHQTTDAYRRPSTRETADHSFFSLTAMALLDGDVSIEQFARGRYLKADVLALSDRLMFRCDLPGADEGRFAAHASATLADGRQTSAGVEFAPGHWRNPLDREGVVHKFRQCAEPSLGPARVSRVAELCLESGAGIKVREVVAAVIS